MAEGSTALTRAQALHDSKRAQEALREIGPALADPQTAAHGYALQALCFAQIGQVDAALRAAKSAQAANPLVDVGYRIEGLIRVNHRRGKGAVPPAREAVRLNPSLTNQYVLVHALREKRDREEARSIAAALVASYPQSVTALDALGICELRSHHWEAAEGLYRQAVALAPHEALYSTRLGEALQGQGKTAEATEAYLASARTDPTDAGHRRRVANAGLTLGTGGAGIVALVIKIGAFGLMQSAFSSAFGSGFKATLVGVLTIVWALIAVFFGFAVLTVWRRLRAGAKLLEPSLRSALAPDRRRSVGGALSYASMWLIPGALLIAVLSRGSNWVCLALSTGIAAAAFALAGREALGMPGWIKRVLHR